MSIRNSLALALVVASAGLFGCDEPRTAEAPSGAIEVVVRSPSDARQLGAFTVRSAQGSRTWRLPLRGEGYQQQRLLLQPGLYALDFDADVSATVADPSLQGRLQTASADLPRWVVVAPAQVTTVHVTARSDTSAPVTPAATPDPRLQVN